ncbi:phosphate acyltransferase [Ruminiclostridium hungatei]|uniref:Phosphate acyltransferase n=1 Tax=Ruminiclostridium hungatei TaxID=48256 RepID=A0A1V4SIX7_RUMHU|nr:phosphate acyltransferase [Ruminiclostridium hungatei]
MINVIVDAMGGDNAPDAIIDGCIEALQKQDDFMVTLVGISEIIKEKLSKKVYDKDRIEIVNATEIITGEDTPTKAIRNKKDSSMVVGLKLLKEKKGDAFLSAGNTGALMTGSLLVAGRMKGIDRPSMPALVPTEKGMCLIIDAGMNTVCKPLNYLQFGIMGSIYMKLLFKLDTPKVGLVNVGSEDGKGNDTLKQAFGLMSESTVNFVGNIEGNDITSGDVDVAVCDGYVGNVALKLYEGVGSFFLKELKKIFTSNILTKICYLLLKPFFKDFRDRFDPDELAGAPVLGINGLVIKSHGSSKAKTIRTAILKRTIPLIKNGIVDEIKDQFKNMEVKPSEDDID